jgi:leucyl-tRNA synthetase
MPVDVMVGGIDQSRTCFFHTRMMARALKEMGHVIHDEPVRELLAIGMVKQDGKKMSKSAGNQVDPDALIELHGADALRLGVLGAAAPTGDMIWSDQSVRQAHAFLASLWQFVDERRAVIDLGEVGSWPGSAPEALPVSPEGPARPTASLRRRCAGWLQAGVGRVTTNMVRHELHLAVKNLMFLFERLVQFDREARSRTGELDPIDAGALSFGVGLLLRMLGPIAPHLAEEVWHRAGGRGMLALAPWPASLDLDVDRRQRGARGNQGSTSPSMEGPGGGSKSI